MMQKSESTSIAFWQSGFIDTDLELWDFEAERTIEPEDLGTELCR